jgi:putative transposase
LKKPSLEQIEEAVDAVLLSEPKLARQVKLHLCHRYSGMRLTQIGLGFGVGQSGVTQASQRIALKRSKDKNLRKIVKRIEKNILL